MTVTSKSVIRKPDGSMPVVCLHIAQQQASVPVARDRLDAGIFVTAGMLAEKGQQQWTELSGPDLTIRIQISLSQLPLQAR
jgi:hypothetical protein